MPGLQNQEQPQCPVGGPSKSETPSSSSQAKLSTVEMKEPREEGALALVGPCTLEEQFLSQQQPWGQRSAYQTLLRDPQKGEGQEGPGVVSQHSSTGTEERIGMGPCEHSLPARPCAQSTGASVQYPRLLLPHLREQRQETSRAAIAGGASSSSRQRDSCVRAGVRSIPDPGSARSRVNAGPPPQPTQRSSQMRAGCRAAGAVGKECPGTASTRHRRRGTDGAPARAGASSVRSPAPGPPGQESCRQHRFLPGAATGRPGGGARWTRDHQHGSSRIVARPGKAVPGPGGRRNRAGTALSHQALPAGRGRARNRRRGGKNGRERHRAAALNPFPAADRDVLQAGTGPLH